ncbi:hypothetical protein EVAR_19011_1 [Eumeta japonica]|uniref:Uncharacterized protein n=1 Tax=Eumeta variegata TaxID=151549 RepID=A0A4C1V7U0_EUMVA|nr:hypothetical protein EVAR_19011_1 [Eumeta japonica]
MEVPSSQRKQNTEWVTALFIVHSECTSMHPLLLKELSNYLGIVGPYLILKIKTSNVKLIGSDLATSRPARRPSYIRASNVFDFGPSPPFGAATSLELLRAFPCAYTHLRLRLFGLDEISLDPLEADRLIPTTHDTSLYIHFGRLRPSSDAHGFSYNLHNPVEGATITAVRLSSCSCEPTLDLQTNQALVLNIFLRRPGGRLLADAAHPLIRLESGVRRPTSHLCVCRRRNYNHLYAKVTCTRYISETSALVPLSHQISVLELIPQLIKAPYTSTKDEGRERERDGGRMYGTGIESR